MTMAKDQKTDDENMGDPVNATGGNSKSPTHGQADAFLGDDNNAHQEVLPMDKIIHDD